ncbi:MAG TPA: transferrin-binding protein-like solute binding protein [Burkholderiales bacterium]|nr:transferrin-binding protein-like solute binding protein [Burkholderiales bacterium]
MKREVKLIAVATAVAMLAGCASSGGTRSSGQSGTGGVLEALICVYTLGFGCPKQSTSSSKSSATSTYSRASTAPASSGVAGDSAFVATAPASFESWSTEPPNVEREAYGPDTIVYYQSGISSTTPQWDDNPGLAYYKYDAKGKLLYFTNLFDTGAYTDLSKVGYAGIDVGFDKVRDDYPQTPFTSVSASAVGLTANPYAYGWEYQSFGIWNTEAAGGEHGYVNPISYGAATPGSAVPLSGSATFTGRLAGQYVSPTGEGSLAAAELSVNADFGARSLSFASTGTITTRDVATASAAPNLDLKGTLSYSPGSNAFSGTLTNSGATMSGSSQGQFYGPVAQELGGVFVVKSPTTVETFTGAYGAKR